MANLEEQIARIVMNFADCDRTNAEIFMRGILFPIIRAELGKMRKIAICAEGFEECYQFALGWNAHADAVDEKLGGGK